MVSLHFKIANLDRNDPKYWFLLLQALSNAKAYLEEIADGNEDESVILSAAECLEYEIERFIRAIPVNDIFVSPEMDPIVEIRDNGTTIQITLDEYLSQFHQPFGDHRLN